MVTNDLTRGIVIETERYLESIRGAKSTLRDVYQRDYHTCDCPMPYIERKWNEALGLFCEIRLCCMAKAVEQLTGVTLFETFEFEPLWEWDCDGLVQQADGTMIKRGPPPKFLQERFDRRGIAVKNRPVKGK